MKSLRRNIGTFMFCTLVIVGVCIGIRLFADILEYVILPGAWTDIWGLIQGWIAVFLSQCITLGIYYMLVPLANALLGRKNYARATHIVIGVAYLVGGIVLLPVSWILTMLFMTEGTRMPYRWREISFIVPYGICYMVGVAQLIYDICGTKRA